MEKENNATSLSRWHRALFGNDHVMPNIRKTKIENAYQSSLILPQFLCIVHLWLDQY